MTSDEYVRALRDLWSRDPDRIREANRLLFAAAVDGDDAEQNPDLALAAVHASHD